MGGMLKAIESGYVYKEIYHAAYEHQKAVEHKKKIIVGVNECVSDKTLTIQMQKIDPDWSPAVVATWPRFARSATRPKLAIASLRSEKPPKAVKI